MEATSRIQQKFYESFPACEKEAEYKFITPSTMKPTQVKCAPGGLNQIPPDATVSGDIRLTPFYDVVGVSRRCIEAEVAAINADIEVASRTLDRAPSTSSRLPGGGEPIVGTPQARMGRSPPHRHRVRLSRLPLSSLMCDAIEEVKGVGGAVLAHRLTAPRARHAVRGFRHSAHRLRANMSSLPRGQRVLLAD